MIKKKEQLIQENEIKRQKGEPLDELLKLNTNDENILNESLEKEIQNYIDRYKVQLEEIKSLEKQIKLDQEQFANIKINHER